MKKSDKYILAVCALVCAALSLVPFFLDSRASMRPWRRDERVLKLLLEKNDFFDLIPTDHPYGKIAAIDVARYIDPSDIPVGSRFYGVGFNPPKAALTMDGQQSENVIGLIGAQGLDFDCDYSEQAMSVKSYAPTNGIQSDGDIVRIIRP